MRWANSQKTHREYHCDDFKTQSPPRSQQALKSDTNAFSPRGLQPGIPDAPYSFFLFHVHIYHTQGHAEHFSAAKQP